MTTCPNCGYTITDSDKICPNCHFNIGKYREIFFTDMNQETNDENKSASERLSNRQAYRQEFYPEKQNETVKKMLQWIHVNSMIVFLLGIFLLLIMSFSRSIGWICFFALLVWLYFVCIRKDKIERYTVDLRLTEKVNQIASNMFNNVENSKQKVRSKSKVTARDQGPKEEDSDMTKKHFGYVQLLVVLMAIINLVVLFTGSGASISDIPYSGKMSITRVTFDLAGRLFSANATILSGAVLCVIWLLILALPIFIIYYTLKDTKKTRIISFFLSLIESLFLIYVIFKMTNRSPSNTGIIKNITSQLLLYAVSIGTSTYFLILSSFMTTILSGYNLFKNINKEQ